MKQPIPQIRKLGQTINMFNRGCSSFERAMHAFENRNTSEYETALLGAAKDVPDALEWTLKIYLRNFPQLDPVDRQKLKEPSFHELMILMEKYAEPSPDKETSIRLYGYRDMRNESSHRGAIPPVDEVRDAIAGIRQIILTYLPVEEEHLKIVDESKETDEVNKRITVEEKTATATSDEVDKDIQETKELIKIHKRRLHELKKQQAIYGGKTDPGVKIEIEEIEIEIKKLQTELNEINSSLQTNATEARPSSPLAESWPPTLPWNEPYYQLPDRDGDVERIVQHLIKKEERWGVFVSGLGGIGKTATAIEIARRCLAAHAFERILGDSAKLEFLVDGRATQADDRATLNFEGFLNELGTQLDQPDIRLKPLEEKRHILQRLLNQASYLVIVDNLETTQNAFQIVQGLSQLLGRSRAIITSREVVSATTIPLRLEVLSEADSLLFLREDAQSHQCEDISHASDALLRKIHQAVGGQPLALKLIVGQAANFGLDFALENVQNMKDDFYRFIYWDSWQKLSLTAQQVLIYLGESPTSVSMEELAYGPFDVETDELMLAIEPLINLSLINVMQVGSRRRYSIHEMTRHFVNSDLPDLWRQQDSQ